MSSSPSTPYNITWLISDLKTGDIINSTTQVGPIREIWPDLYFDLCKLMGADEVCISRDGVYVCPGTGRTRDKVRNCGGPKVGFCGAWGCETTVTVSWKQGSSTDMIKVQEVPGTNLPPGHCGGKDCKKCLNGVKGRCHPLNVGSASVPICP